MTPSLTAVMIAHNESANLEGWSKSLDWCDHKLLIDDNSTDDTVQMAKKLGITVVSHALSGDFAAQRNFALQQVTTDWVFFVDGDERVSEAMKKEIQEKLQTHHETLGYSMRRIDHLFGKTLHHGDMGNVALLRLGRKDAGEWSGKVHEVWNMRDKTESLDHALEHYPHPTLNDFLSEINHYSTLRAEELYAQKVQTNYFYIIAYPAGKFLQDYFLKGGYQDGEVGLIVAILMSFHSFLVRGKLWLLWHKK